MLQRIYGLPATGRAAAARLLVEQGFDSVVVGADATAEGVQPALDAGLAVWGCRGAFTIRHLSESDAALLLARDVDGVPRVWFNSGCPNQPALRDAHLRAVERLARSGVFAGFMLDGIRFASPNAGEGFFSCFCDVCRSRAAALGYDFEGMHRAVAALRDWCRQAHPAPLAADPADLPAALAAWPGASQWLRFRAACVAEHVAEVRQVIQTWRPAGAGESASVDSTRGSSPPFLLGAYVFTPAFARLVGQRYGDLAPLLDVLSPMIYRVDLGGDSCLTPEWDHLARLRLAPPHGPFTVADVTREVARARALLGGGPVGGCTLAPILRLSDDLVADTTRGALDAGAGGLDYFVYRGGEEAYLRQASAAIAAAAAG